MCGIVGAAANLHHQVPPVDVTRRMCAAIRHRGPDDEGIFHSPQAFLGMRRLAIIDPDGGKQPIYNETGEICAVVNGEIYNFRELRERLEARGHRFHSGSDVECVVHAYEEYGADCFAELRGMFAVAIWDGRSHTLVLGRDRFGKKPLFYTESSRGLYFASELKSLLPVPELTARLNRNMIPDYLLLGYVPTPESMLENVHKLPPGHYLAFREGHAVIRRYWSLSYGPKFLDDEATLVDALEARLDDAVRVRLQSDVPFGAFLSGGIDSSLVVALMTRHLDQPVHTFSIGFEESEFNESDDARRVAEHLGTRHEDFIVRPDAVAMLHDIAWYMDEPLADSSAIPTFIVSQMAAKHVKMVLTGDGGDEMFAGYERYSRYMQLRALRQLGLPHLLPLLKHALRGLPSRIGRRAQWVATRLGMTHPEDYLSGVALGTPASIRGLLGSGLARPHGYGRVRACFDGNDDTAGPLDTVLRGDVQSYLLDDILVKVDRMSMGNSLEARAPLLDHKLAEFAARLPERMKLRGSTGKYLLKKVAARHLPESCVHKRKQGFAIPLARWLRTDLRDLLMDTVHGAAFRDRDAFDTSTVRRLAGEHVRGHRDHSETLWSVLVFELWAQRYLEPASARSEEGIKGFRLASS